VSVCYLSVWGCFCCIYIHIYTHNRNNPKLTSNIHTHADACMALRSEVATLALPSSVVSQTSLHRIAVIVEGCKDYLKSLVLQWIGQRQHEPILISTQADGTWSKTVERHKTTAGDKSVIRSGGQGADIYLQRCFFKSNAGDTLILIDEPKAMILGKSSWHCFAANQTLFTNARCDGHLGVAINFYCYDRAQFSSLMNIHIPANRKACHDYAAANPMLDANEMVLKDWTIGVACSDHDCQNSLKWAMEPCHAVSATDTYNNLHIAIASLRNGWDIIMRELPDWLSCTVRFCDEPWDDA
jgi:hypothetical protein